MRTAIIGAVLLLSGAAGTLADESQKAAEGTSPPAYAPPAYSPPATEPHPGEPDYGKRRVQTLPYTPGPSYASPRPYYPSVPQAAPPAAVPHASRPSPYSKPSKLDHLRSAVEHLEAAGAKEEATRVRQLLADEIKLHQKELLKQKEAQLKTLQEEVERLRRGVGSPQQVMLQVKIYEVSLSKLRTMGIDFAHVSGGDALTKRYFDEGAAEKDESAGCDAIDDDHPFLTTLNRLQELNIARLVSDPCLVATLGRPARFASGGEIQVQIPDNAGTLKNEICPLGTQVDFTPQLLNDERMRLEFRISLRELAEPSHQDPAGQPRIHVCEVATGAELKIGQLLVLGGMKQIRSATEVNRSADPPTKTTLHNTIATFFVIHPHLVDNLDTGTLEAAASGAALPIPQHQR